MGEAGLGQPWPGKVTNSFLLLPAPVGLAFLRVKGSCWSKLGGAWVGGPRESQEAAEGRRKPCSSQGFKGAIIVRKSADGEMHLKVGD